MDKRALLISAIATVAGVALLQLHLRRVEQDALGGPKQQVLVLLADAAAGTALTRELLATRELPQAYRESRHIAPRQLNEIVGLRLALAVHAHDALLWTDLASLRPAPRTLASLIPSGMRALSVSVRAGGFDALLAPGDRVDVLLARDDGAGGDARLIAENLLVLAIGDLLSASGRTARGGSGDVTLSVSPEQSLALAGVERRGSLRLVLRHPDDVGVTVTSAPDAEQVR